MITGEKIFVSADILEVKINANKLMGGDAGHGGYLNIEIKSTNQFEINGQYTYFFNMYVMGDSERENLRDAFRYMADYLDQELK
jgi:hypothetical protein